METCSSAEDVTVKTRKPYTITKQRERWTEDEHGRFLEALKLHGRAWQRIEEHIGTKTAVQIRSHAQKFFTKLEKEAQKKGVPFGDVHHIDIPPPRPKRKPSNPYPRKTYGSSISSLGEAKDETSLRSASSLCLNQQVLVLEKDAPFEKHTGTETSQRTEGASEDGNRSEILNLFQDNPCTSRSSENKRSANSHITGEFIPLVGEIKKSTTHESSSTVKVTETTKGNWDDHTDLDNGILKVLDINSKLMREENEVGSGQTQEPILLLKTKPQSGQSCPKHVPVHFIDGNKDKCDKSMYSESSDQPISSSLDHQVGSNSNPNPFTNPFINSSSSMPSIHQDSPTFSPFVQFNNNQDSYRFFLNFSSTFSSLIISSLLQNPAAHAAANLAASFFPSPDLETSIGSTSDAFVGTIPQVNPSSGMAAIASATVAAASAWWATHGLFPLSHPPLPTGIAFMATQANSVPIPTTETPQATGDEKERKGDCTQKGEQLLDPQSSMSLGTQCVTARSFLISSSGSDEGGGERSHCTVLKSPLEYPPNSTLNGGLHKSDETRSKTNIYRSSCGSNTTSSSELETDIVLEQVEECKEADKEANCGETNNRRFKSIGSVNESWKEVSEEGRIAFQALFSREVLPQSFSRTNTAGDGIMRPCREKEAIKLGADLSIVECGATLNGIQCTNKDDSSLRSNENLDELFLIGQGKLKTRRTGFKPYKRCSVDAKESRGAPVSEEKGIKRIRLQE